VATPSFTTIMDTTMRTTNALFRLVEAAFSLVFFGAVAHHVLKSDFKPLLALGVPMLIVFYGFASVLFVRGKALAPGLWQTRSLYAAERATQATVLYLLGVLLGVTVYALIKPFGALDLSASWTTRLWLLAFVAPYALMQMALLSFLRGLWALAPDLLRDDGALAVARRVSQR
jgi:hypothetical protein